MNNEVAEWVAASFGDGPGDMPAGTRLPKAIDLARELGIAVNKVSVSMRVLHAMGELETIGDGRYYYKHLPLHPLPRTVTHLERIILELIRANVILPGAALPLGAQLDEVFSIGRPQRSHKAYCLLAARGILVRSGKRFFVETQLKHQLVETHYQNLRASEPSFYDVVRRSLPALRPGEVFSVSRVVEGMHANRQMFALHALRRFDLIETTGSRSYALPLSAPLYKQRISICQGWLERFHFPQGDRMGRQAFLQCLAESAKQGGRHDA